MKKGTIAKSHVKGWQTMAEAAREKTLSKQRIHQLVIANRIPSKWMLGVLLVPRPFPKPKAP